MLYLLMIAAYNYLTRACLDQLSIVIRSLTLLCDHSRSRTRVIAIMNLIAKLSIIYAIRCHASLCTTTYDCVSSTQLSLPLHSAYYYRVTRHGQGRWEVASQLQQQLALWVYAKYCASCH